MFNVNEFKACIKRKGETQEDAARVMGIKPATLYRKMNGISDFFRNEIEAFCVHYNANPDDVFFSNRSA